MKKENLHLLCEWCGWEGREDELDKNEHDEPACCPNCGNGSFSTVNIDKNETRHCSKFDKRNTLKKFLVVLSPENKIPKDGWDVAFERIRLQVCAINTKAARCMTVEAMKVHHLYCKVTYIRELKGE